MENLLPSLGRLSLIDQEIEMTALLGKWIVYALEPSVNILKTLLRFRLERTKPWNLSGWGNSLKWFTARACQFYIGLKVWSHIGKAWQQLSLELS